MFQNVLLSCGMIVFVAVTIFNTFSNVLIYSGLISGRRRSTIENIFEILSICVYLNGVEWCVRYVYPHFKRNHQFRVYILNSENPNNAKLTAAPTTSYRRVSKIS